MQNKEIIKNLYYGWIDESERKRERTERDEEEYKAYEALYATFTEEQKALFRFFVGGNCRFFLRFGLFFLGLFGGKL